MMNNSYLMLAGDKQKHLDKLDSLKCDIAIVNLEDGVYDKDMARNLVYKNLKTKDNKNIVVRVNDLDTCAKKDIRLINKIKPKAIRIAKIKTIEDVKIALELIDDDIEVHLSIETKEALHNLELLKINPRVTTVYLGILDMLESLGLPQNLVQLNNPTIDYILSRFLISSKIAGFEAVSFVYQDYKNIEEFTSWCKKEKSLGFISKVCISPTQVDIVNNIHITDEIELQKANYIIKVFEQNKENKNTAIADELYGFIDEPIYKDALLFLKNN
ncbi:MAG TPA: CoA ester lyase [Arcobacter sp.]|nr:CoA ester lyase [Arcobacter sp.]HIP55616.1 CoA ester lyase [Arcobacter sp.]